MRASLRIATWLALGSLRAVHPAFAQSPALPPAAGAVPPGAEVRVSLNGVRFEGRVLGGARDTLVVAPALGGAPVRTALTPSDTVWVPIGRAWRRGALIGAGVGAAALSGLAIAYARAMCSPGASCGTGYGVLLGVTVGGTGGAALGAALGATVRRWQRVRP